MERYTNAELADMHLTYEAAGRSERTIQWLYAQRYPRKQTPNHAFLALEIVRHHTDPSSWRHRKLSK
ncbi:hypothetical protein TNCV_2266701, partial [Trichonephila clavipes]